MPRGGGKRPKLDALHALDGTVSQAGRSAARTRGFRFSTPASRVTATGEPFSATHLHADAKACIEIIRDSMPPGVYARLDSFLLAAFATAWAVHKTAVEMMADPDFSWMVERTSGTGENTHSHWEPNAWIKVASNHAALMASLGDRLGLDPKSRAGITAQAERRGSQTVSKFDGLLSARMPAGDEPTAS